MKRLALLNLMLLVATASLRAQTLQDVDKQEAALDAAWEKTPLTVRKAFFVTKHPSAFGGYTQRSSDVFKPGEPLLAYIEPVGYGWKGNGNGVFDLSVSVDFLVKTEDGNIVGGKEDFQRLVLQSHVKNKELMLTLTLNVRGAPAGNYTVEYKLRDLVTEKTATVDLPFTIAAQ
jgi:hypothetical protein